MADDRKTRDQLLDELEAAHLRIAQLSRGQRDEGAPLDRDETWRLLIERAPNFVVIVGGDHRVQFINSTQPQHSKGEVIGRPFAEFLPPADRERVTDIIREAIEGGRTGHYETQGPGADSKTVGWFNTTVSPFRQGDAVVGACLICTDITERATAEEERLNLERQVLQSQKLESLGILAGGVAHDFNNILTGLLGNVDLALYDLSPHSPVRPLLLDVQRAGRRAADLTRQMLAYSGKGRFVVEDVGVNALVQDMASLLASTASKKTILRYELSAGLPGVRGDATQLRQILLNLVSNASDALGEQDGVVAVETYTDHAERGLLDAASSAGELAEGRYVTIQVSDSGCGMEEETKARIFDPFFTTKFAGRGLGLAAVQGIVRGHKGAILVESEVGEGTTFKVLLPALDHAVTPVVAQSSGDQDWHGTGTILLVDDEEMVRTVVCKALERLGLSVLTAADGLEAVELFRERHGEITCVLLDLKMPRMGGEEVYDEIRSISTAMPVILSTGYSEQESTKLFGDKGLAGFLNKPYGVATLKRKLREVLGG